MISDQGCVLESSLHIKKILELAKENEISIQEKTLMPNKLQLQFDKDVKALILLTGCDEQKAQEVLTMAGGNLIQANQWIVLEDQSK